MLIYHVRSHHTTIKPYICPLSECDFSTVTKVGLKQHLLCNKHRDIMSVPLLNKILAMDTKRGQKETRLLAPRESKTGKRRRNSDSSNSSNTSNTSNTSNKSKWSNSPPIYPPHKKRKIMTHTECNSMQTYSNSAIYYNNLTNNQIQTIPIQTSPMPSNQIAYQTFYQYEYVAAPNTLGLDTDSFNYYCKNGFIA